MHGETRYCVLCGAEARGPALGTNNTTQVIRSGGEGEGEQVGLGVFTANDRMVDAVRTDRPETWALSWGG